MTKLLVDDTRVLLPSAKAEGWVLLRTGEAVAEWIAQHGWPAAIAFDYDFEMAGGTWDGGRIARWLRDEFQQLGNPAALFPIWDVHSRNPANNDEVERILEQYSARRCSNLAPIRRS